MHTGDKGCLPAVRSSVANSSCRRLPVLRPQYKFVRSFASPPGVSFDIFCGLRSTHRELTGFSLVIAFHAALCTRPLAHIAVARLLNLTTAACELSRPVHKAGVAKKNRVVSATLTSTELR